MPLQQQLKEHYYAASLIRAVKTNIPSFASTMICVRGSSRPPFLPWQWRMKSLSFAVSALDVNLFSSHIDFIMLLSCCNCFIYIKKVGVIFTHFLYCSNNQNNTLWFDFLECEPTKWLFSKENWMHARLGHTQSCEAFTSLGASEINFQTWQGEHATTHKDSGWFTMLQKHSVQFNPRFNLLGAA